MKKWMLLFARSSTLTAGCKTENGHPEPAFTNVACPDNKVKLFVQYNIMKNKLFYLSVLFFACILCACDKKEEAPVSLSVTPESLSFESAGGSNTFNIYTGGNWNIAGKPTWVSLSAVNGSKDAVITVTIEGNTDEKSRNTQLTIEVPGVPSKTVGITQKGKSGQEGGKEQTVNSTAGNLKNSLTEQEWKNVTSLTIKGDINESDFKTIKAAASQLKYLDISGTSLTKIFDYALSKKKENVNNSTARPGRHSAFAAVTAGQTEEQEEPMEPPKEPEQGWEVAMPYLEEVVIPEGTDSIGICAFAGCEFLTKVSLPEGLKVIEWDAFSGCKALPEVQLPSTLEKINARAFFGCEALTSIIIPAGVTHLGDQCFARSGLTAVEIPATVKEIEGTTFANCGNLASAKLPGERKIVPDGIFAWCTKLTGSAIELPASIQKIGGGAFYGCTALTDFTFLPRGVTELGYGAFAECTGLTSSEGLPAGLEKMEPSVFMRCTSLNTFIVPDKIKVLDHFTFYECSKLASVTLPQGMDSIKQSAFEGCSALKAIELPDHISCIDHWGFKDCANLEKITLPAALNYNVTANYLLHPVFEGCNNLSEIVFPAGMHKIPGHLFRGCQGLKKIVIPEQITEIGAGAFSDCTNLAEVTLPDNLISYGGFVGCSSLKTIELPAKITSLGGFSDCISLEKVTAKGKITNIEGQCFSGCVSLKTFDVPEGVTYLPERVFGGCTGLAKLTLPATLTYIQDFAFSHCSSMSEMICHAVTPPEIDNQSYSFNYIINSRCVLKVPAASVDKYKNAAVWKEIRDRIVSLEGGSVKKHIKQFTMYPSLTGSTPESVMTFVYNSSGTSLEEVNATFSEEDETGNPVNTSGKIFISGNAQGEYIITMPGEFINESFTGGTIKTYYTLNAAGLAVSSRREYINLSGSFSDVTYAYKYDTDGRLIESKRSEDGTVKSTCTGEWSNGNLTKMIVTEPGQPAEVYDQFTYSDQKNLSGFIAADLLPELYMNDPFDFIAYTAGILGKGSVNYPTCGSFGKDPMFSVSYTFDSNGDPSRIDYVDGVGTSQAESFYSILVFE